MELVRTFVELVRITGIFVKLVSVLLEVVVAPSVMLNVGVGVVLDMKLGKTLSNELDDCEIVSVDGGEVDGNEIDDDDVEFSTK